jgi:hypothetical protein
MTENMKVAGERADLVALRMPARGAEKQTGCCLARGVSHANKIEEVDGVAANSFSDMSQTGMGTKWKVEKWKVEKSGFSRPVH